jgi:hypothetical protein
MGIAGIVIMIVVHSSNSSLMFMKLKIELIIVQVIPSSHEEGLILQGKIQMDRQVVFKKSTFDSKSCEFARYYGRYYGRYHQDGPAGQAAESGHKQIPMLRHNLKSCLMGWETSDGYPLIVKPGKDPSFLDDFQMEKWINIENFQPCLITGEEITNQTL